ncbi:MAG: CPBP family intramembrane metalloprotease [Clostridia bacterium]|nr:CPBP family intramembrane metalloprotease [Clostridia bacterium]
MTYNYGIYPPPAFQPDPEGMRQAENWLANKRKIRRLGNIFGVAVIAVTLLTELVSGLITGITLFMRSSSDTATYRDFTRVWNGTEVQSIINIFYSAVVIGGTFLVVYLLNKSDPYARIPFLCPKPAGNVPIIIAGALSACLAANLVTGLIDTFIFNSNGQDVYNAVMPSTPDTALGMVLYFVSVALLPPMIEEFALRGVVMQPLRRFGDGFAIVVSAFLFAALHSTPIQIVFAFAAGLFIGYATIITGSVWTGIIIHCLNNSVSVISAIIIDTYGETSSESVIFTYIYYAVIGVGAVATVSWFLRKKRVHLRKSPLVNSGPNAVSPPSPYVPVITNGSLYWVFFSSPGMIIAYFFIAWRLFETLLSLRLLGG